LQDLKDEEFLGKIVPFIVGGDLMLRLIREMQEEVRRIQTTQSKELDIEDAREIEVRLSSLESMIMRGMGLVR